MNAILTSSRHPFLTSLRAVGRPMRPSRSGDILHPDLRPLNSSVTEESSVVDRPLSRGECRDAIAVEFVRQLIPTCKIGAETGDRFSAVISVRNQGDG